jgi:hypothetical protein
MRASFAFLQNKLLLEAKNRSTDRLVERMWIMAALTNISLKIWFKSTKHFEMSKKLKHGTFPKCFGLEVVSP